MRTHRAARIAGLAAAGFLSAAQSGCEQHAAADADSAPLVVGMELSYPPFEMLDRSGAPDGVGVRMVKALGESLDRPVEIRNIPFDGLIPALQSGKVDLVVSSMTATEERRRAIDFSDPYVRTGICLLVGRDSGVAGEGDLNDPQRRVVVKLATTGESYARQHLPEAEIVALDQDAACVLEVSQGKADAFIYDQLSVFRYAQRNKDTTRAILQPLREEFWAIGIRKENDALLADVNRALEEFRAEGGFDRLADKFLTAEKEMLEEQGIPFIFETRP